MILASRQAGRQTDRQVATQAGRHVGRQAGRQAVRQVASVAETGFSHRLTAYKIVGHFFGLPYLNISVDNHVKNTFFIISNISAPCPHVQLRGRTVIKKLLTFFGPWGRDRSLSTPC